MDRQLAIKQVSDAMMVCHPNTYAYVTEDLRVGRKGIPPTVDHDGQAARYDGREWLIAYNGQTVDKLTFHEALSAAADILQAEQ